MTKKQTQALMSNIFYMLEEHQFVHELTVKDAITYEMITFSKDGRNYRFILRSMTLEQGDNDFDRWANSVERTVTFSNINVDVFFKKLNKLVQSACT